MNSLTRTMKNFAQNRWILRCAPILIAAITLCALQTLVLAQTRQSGTTRGELRFPSYSQAKPASPALQEPHLERSIVFDLGPGGKLSVQDSAFKVGSAALEPSSLPFFNALAKYLIQRPDLQIEIRGHASSEGDPVKNQRLSEERAEMAKQYLVEKFDILPSRIRTRGFGDKQPIKSNSNEEGRSQNRRVEIVGVNPSSETPLTSETGKAAEGIGKVSLVQNKVQLRAPWELDFHTAKLNSAVHEYHRISTGDNSRAEITFNEGTKIVVTENTTLTILSSGRERAAGKPQENVRLYNGNLFVKLQGGGVANKLTVQTADSKVEFDSSNAGSVNVDSSGNRSTVSVFEGKSARVNLINAGDSTIEVKGGYGLSLSGDGAQTVRRIPPTPELLSPVAELAAVLMIPSPVFFKWRSAEQDARLEIARDASFSSIVYEQMFRRVDSVSMNLDSGTYYYRLTALDNLGIQSKPVEGVLQVGGGSVRPIFQPTGFFLLLAAAAALWVSFLINTPFQSRYVSAYAIENNALRFNFTENPRYLTYRLFGGWTLDHRSFLLLLRSLAFISALIGVYILV